MGEERETAAMAELSSSVSFDDEDGIAVITVDNPPVNALSWHVRQGIFDGLSRASAEGASAVVLLCAAAGATPAILPAVKFTLELEAAAAMLAGTSAATKSSTASLTAFGVEVPGTFTSPTMVARRRVFARNTPAL